MIIEILVWLGFAVFGWVAGQFMAWSYVRAAYLPAEKVIETVRAMHTTNSALAESAFELFQLFDSVTQSHLGWKAEAKGKTFRLMDGDKIVEEHTMTMGPGDVSALLEYDTALLDALLS